MHPVTQPPASRDRKPILGLDLDEVVFAYTEGLRNSLAASLGLDGAEALARYPDNADWDYVRAGWFDSAQEYLAAHTAAVESGLYLTMPMVAGASEALWRLSDDGVRIRVVTHRLFAKGSHSRVVADTVAALDAAGIPYSDICFAADKTQVGADLYLDDAPHNVEALRSAGHPAIVFDRPHNRHVAGPRATGWEEAEQLIRTALI